MLDAKYRYGTHDKKYEYKVFFTSGVLYSEESIGTNAVSIAKIHNSPVCLYPEFHYCNMLKKWYEYCVPVKRNGFTDAYLSVVSIQYPISRALKGFIDLLGFNLQKDYSEVNYKATKPLTEKQVMMLKMIAQGLSDEYMSQQLHISLATVKYHNQEIFKKLNAVGRVDAVTRAILNNDLTLFDLYGLYS
ncbi:MAG TPA: LuxR C-terminal-related transcriptional regulator [Ruminiclostridium sp.]|nr:LuxR C-terminal-related transcriptional regulator [Ruminiclostridium sp.]